MRAATEAEWQAILARAPGDLVYGVLTTGIFCRIGCPSRPPLRGNLRVLAGAEEAAAADLRPCKRCQRGFSGGPKPDSAGS